MMSKNDKASNKVVRTVKSDVKVVCCNCGKEFPPDIKLDPALWICTSQCYLVWFEKHLGRPLRSLEPKENDRHGL